MTREQLFALGLGRGAIDWRIRRGVLTACHVGVYLWGAHTASPVGRALAAVYACGEGAVLSHRAAAALWEICPDNDEPIDVTVIGRRVRPAGIRPHETRSLSLGDVRTLHGIALTSPARTLLDCAGDLPTHDLATNLERARVDRLVTKHEIQATIDRAPGRPGAPSLRALITDAPFTRSEAERRLAALLRAAKLPRPDCNTKVEGFEVDAVWRPERVILEFDSHTFHATRAAFLRDRRRDAIHTRARYLVLRATAHELDNEPHALIARTAEALALRRC